jgi:hypothetical protein
MKPFASILHAEYAGRGEHVTVALSKRARFWGRNLNRGRPNIGSNLDVVGVCASTHCDIFGFFAKAWNIPIIDCIFLVKRIALGRINCNPKPEAKMEFIPSYTLPPNHFHDHMNALLDAFKDEGSLQKQSVNSMVGLFGKFIPFSARPLVFRPYPISPRWFHPFLNFHFRTLAFELSFTNFHLPTPTIEVGIGYGVCHTVVYHVTQVFPYCILVVTTQSCSSDLC